jgi:hypothetical protein
LATEHKLDVAAQRARDINAQFVRDKEFRDRWIGVFIGVLALFMALCTLVGNNIAKDANRFHIEANNVWNFFQAKNLRRQILRLKIDELEIDLASNTALQPAVREAFVRKLADYKALDAGLTSDKARNEGLDELFARGKHLENERDLLLKKDPYFDWAQTLLQIAIVLASVCLVTGTMWLLYVSAGLGLMGLLLMLNGYWLLFALPFLG